MFDESLFRETLHENPTVRMIEIKLSQGAKPGHGGILPKSKITPEIASARKLPYPATHDCHSPPNHSAFSDHVGLVDFVSRLRECSGCLHVGIKLCVGDPRDVACLVRAMVETGTGPDFVTVDGGEGGMGAAPPEYSDSIGLPLEEGLVVVRNILIRGANAILSLVLGGCADSSVAEPNLRCFFGDDHGAEAVVGRRDAYWASGRSAITNDLSLSVLWVVGMFGAD